MAGFVQIVEFRTTRIDELRKLSEEMSPASGDALLRRTVTADRDRPGHYFNIVEFDSYDSAMENSSRSGTSEFAVRMAELCDEPPTFHNLNVIDTGDRESSGRSKTGGKIVTRARALAGAAAVGFAAAAAAAKNKANNETREQDADKVEYPEVTAVPATEAVRTTTIDEPEEPFTDGTRSADYPDQGRPL